VHSLSLVVALLLTQTPDSRLLAVNGASSELSYLVSHKLHEVSGKSKRVEGKALLRAGGAVQLMVRAPIASFDSGDGNRDEHMRETLEEAKFNFVVFKGVAQLPAVDKYPAAADLDVEGELDFHGRKLAEKIPVHVDFASPGQAHVTTQFAVSLDRYQVERPSLLFIKLDDACVIKADLNLKEEAK